MGALIIALVPILQGAFAGTAISVILSNLTLIEWASIAAAIANLVTPAVEDAMKPMVQKEIAALHPVFEKMFADVIKHGPIQAAANAYAFDFENPNTPGIVG